MSDQTRIITIKIAVNNDPNNPFGTNAKVVEYKDDTLKEQNQIESLKNRSGVAIISSGEKVPIETIKPLLTANEEIKKTFTLPVPLPPRKTGGNGRKTKRIQHKRSGKRNLSKTYSKRS